MESEQTIEKPGRRLRIETHVVTKVIFVLILLASIVYNIYQNKCNADLRVDAETCDLQVKNATDRCDMFMVTKNLIINDFILTSSTDEVVQTWKMLLELNRLSLHTIDEMGKVTESKEN